MKELFKLRTILCWIATIGAYWLTALLFPYNFYYQDTFIPAMSLAEILIFGGITAGLGTVMHLLMQGVSALGKYIGMKKNLILYFAYYFAICSLFAWGSDQCLSFIKIEPFGIYLLLGFFPAMLCSIIYSYHVSHCTVDEAKK
ncbi:MAG: hypothetical protein J6B54_00545 [Clostridia bacterium]|nr:hypothetical protein [Clostridia bacterium]